MSELRQRKSARTRLALADALTKALTRHTLAEISVKQLCQEAELSEATFFNYFRRKSDLMAYQAQLWLLELGWHLGNAPPESNGLAAVDLLFSRTAVTCARQPGVFRELIVWLVRGGELSDIDEMAVIDKRLAFPQLEGIENVPVKGVDAWLAPQLDAAMRRQELPDNALLPMTIASLLTILFGVPLTFLAKDPARIASVYRQQLTILWVGIRASASRPKSA